jgi:plastocyanin
VQVGCRTGRRIPLAAVVVCAAVAAALMPACQEKASPSGPSGPEPGAIITITATGASPRSVQIAIGDRVRFVNNDARSHAMFSDPHPDHTDCPFINQVGFLFPGQNRETDNSIQPRTCGFHDHDDPDNQGLRGTIATK